MKHIVIITFFLLIRFTSNSQSFVSTKEIKISYTNGYEIFNVCSTNPKISYDDKKEYFWYQSQFGIKSTKGGTGGQLLHGNCKYFDESGNLLEDKNYILGIISNKKSWDSIGNVKSTYKYEEGDMIYWKFKDGDYWVEHIGRMFKEGWLKKTYTRFNELIEEEEQLSGYKRHIKTYYTNENHSLKEDFYIIFDYGLFIGKYTDYFEGGKIKTIGEFYDKKNIMPQYAKIKIGNWIIHNSDGTVAQSLFYKPEIILWNDGKLKSIGFYVHDSKSNIWQKSGEWRTYSEDEKLLNSKKYNWGIEVK